MVFAIVAAIIEKFNSFTSFFFFFVAVVLFSGGWCRRSPSRYGRACVGCRRVIIIVFRYGTIGVCACTVNVRYVSFSFICLLRFLLRCGAMSANGIRNDSSERNGAASAATTAVPPVDLPAVE